MMHMPTEINSELKNEYEYIASQIKKEDSLINSRMTWVLQLNGFFFAALALVGKDIDPQLRSFFLLAIPIIGLATTFSGLIGVSAADLQLRYLIGLWTQERFPGWPRPFGDPKKYLLGRFTAYLPLSVLLIAWLALLVYVNLSNLPHPNIAF